MRGMWRTRSVGELGPGELGPTEKSTPRELGPITQRASELGPNVGELGPNVGELGPTGPVRVREPLRS